MLFLILNFHYHVPGAQSMWSRAASAFAQTVAGEDQALARALTQGGRVGGSRKKRADPPVALEGPMLPY